MKKEIKTKLRETKNGDRMKEKKKKKKMAKKTETEINKNKSKKSRKTWRRYIELHYVNDRDEDGDGNRVRENN